MGFKVDHWKSLGLGHSLTKKSKVNKLANTLLKNTQSKGAA